MGGGRGEQSWCKLYIEGRGKIVPVTCPEGGDGLSGPARCHHMGIRLCVVEVMISWGKVDTHVFM